MFAHLVALILIFSESLQASVTIPTNLSSNDQTTILQTLGFGTGFRAMDNPAPLGANHGFELGLSVEEINTQNIGLLGSGAPTTTNFIYPRFNLAKGIFDQIDLMFTFLPNTVSLGAGMYGGALRWSFFKSNFIPAIFSLLISGSSSSFGATVFTQTVGVDVISGVNLDPVSFYIGAGSVYAQGQFDPTITATAGQTNQVTRTFHTLGGASLNLGSFFSAFEIDHYTDITFSLNTGVRL